ncbi:thioredoxin [Candidatus Saccharibacteria bacterium]|nr:thioredoxin [Candidatus Saccharibacteria bacterium]
MQELSSDNFIDTIKSGVTLVDFNADWCGPCQMQKPILEEIAKESDGKYQIAGLNVDDEPDIASEYGVSSIPCMVIFKDGKEVERIVGLRPKAALVKSLEKHNA